MKELLTIGSALVVVFGSFCGILLKITNGRINKQFNNLDKEQSTLHKRINERVEITACHRAQDDLKEHFDTRIEDSKKHLSEKLDMAISLIKNGR